MGIRTATAVGGLVLMVSTAAAADPVSDGAMGRVTVRTFNYYGISSQDLGKAREQAAGILRSAGIVVSWLDCSVAKGATTTEPDVCRQPIGPDLMLRISNSGGSDARNYLSMGFSLVNAMDGQAPYLATVYTDRVNSIARRSRLDLAELLGRAIAHEIGHLLLGTNEHASRGLMRATWSQAEMHHHNAMDWQFRPDEVVVMHAALANRLSTAATSHDGSARQNITN
jgi:hypothetical protein